MRYAVAALIALVASPLAAQEWQVARESFAFAGTRLTIHVDAESPGTLRILRGAPGAVRVASRASRGFTAAGLGGDDELTLTVAGPGPVDYLVSVPEEVWIRVLLPGSTRPRSLGGHTPSASFEWGAAAAAPGPVDRWLPEEDSAGTPPYTTFVRDVAPSIVRIPRLAQVHSLGVRIEGHRFRVLASRPLTVRAGSDDRLEIRPSGPPMDLVLTIPLGTRGFQLEAGGGLALLVDGDSVRAFCSPMTQQWLSNGRRWLTFNPMDGALRCADPPGPRHEG